MDPVAAPTLGGLGGLPPPGVDEVVTTGYAGGPLGVALPPPASSDIGLGALGPPNDPPVPPGAASLGGLPLGAAAPGMQPPPSAFGPTSLSEAVSHRLDAGALRALAELETAEADAIAQRLEQAGATVRNPSAYVHRAVNNARRRGTQAPPYGQPGGAYGGGAAAGQLDQNALSALQELPQEQATSILDELASKGAGVRNPSAYVVKAVGNARRQLEGGGRFYGGGPPRRAAAGLRRRLRPPADARPAAGAARLRRAAAALRPHGPAARLPRRPLLRAPRRAAAVAALRHGRGGRCRICAPRSEGRGGPAGLAGAPVDADPFGAAQEERSDPQPERVCDARHGERRRGHGARHGAVAPVRPVSSTAAAAAAPVRPVSTAVRPAAGSGRRHGVPAAAVRAVRARLRATPPAPGAAPGAGAAPDYAAYADAEAAYAAYAAKAVRDPARPPAAPEPGA